MLRAALIATALALAFPAAAAAAAGPASVALTACVPDERAVEFEARMDKVAGSARMKLKFALQARKPGRRAWRRVAAPELGGWRTAAPATTRFISSRRVTALVGPAAYRALVRFRWVDARGRTVAHGLALSRSCHQPDHRPNLRLQALSIEGGDAYAVLVANTGRSASGPFDLVVGGLATVAVGSLEPGADTLVELEGPRCPRGASVTATADPLDLIDERNEADNALTRACP